MGGTTRIGRAGGRSPAYRDRRPLRHAVQSGHGPFPAPVVMCRARFVPRPSFATEPCRMTSILVHSGTLVRMDEGGTVGRGDLLVRDGVIAALGDGVAD